VEAGAIAELKHAGMTGQEIGERLGMPRHPVTQHECGGQCCQMFERQRLGCAGERLVVGPRQNGLVPEPLTTSCAADASGWWRTRSAVSSSGRGWRVAALWVHRAGPVHARIITVPSKPQVFRPDTCLAVLTARRVRVARSFFGKGGFFFGLHAGWEDTDGTVIRCEHGRDVPAWVRVRICMPVQ
jgi:hypothetical protein